MWKQKQRVNYWIANRVRTRARSDHSYERFFFLQRDDPTINTQVSYGIDQQVFRGIWCYDEPKRNAQQANESKMNNNCRKYSEYLKYITVLRSSQSMINKYAKKWARGKKCFEYGLDWRLVSSNFAYSPMCSAVLKIWESQAIKKFFWGPSK